MTLLPLLIVLFTQVTVTNGAPCDFNIDTVFVTEGTEKGTCIYRLSDEDNVQEVHYSTSPPFLHVLNGSLCLNATLSLDTDQDLCKYLENNGQWTLYVTCDDRTTEQRVNILVNFTDDFPPAFPKPLFSVEQQEMTMVRTTVEWFRKTDLTDADCSNTLQPGVNTLFKIEDGDTGDAFELNSERTGELVVTRWLDYEHGDRHFVFNVSLADKNNPDRKSQTTLEVKVNDIDDSDPVFAHPDYRLHVTEENSSSVGIWLLTDPPVSVRDPDVDVTPQDTLIVSLYNSSDESKIKVREDGAVQLMTTLDRETTPTLTVILKVQQNISYWRSSTVTLTVTVEDVNDNRPEFEPSVYHFTLPEHSVQATSVGLLWATDRDSGDNAVFNYTLMSHHAQFNMETLELPGGGGLVGVLRVGNSTLLDREDSPELMLTVGTTEREAEDGGDCSKGDCEATVKVTLLDINDNSPVFERPSYNATVRDYVADDVIITIQASDDDEGDYGDVVYAVRTAGPGVCDDLTVAERSGAVSLGQSVRHSVHCSVLLDACDSPLQPLHRRCASVGLQVNLLVSNYTVVLYTSVSPQVLGPYTQDIQRELSDILRVDVTVIDIAFDSSTQGSEVIISATNGTAQDALPHHKLQQLVEEHNEEIRLLFLSYLPSPTSTNPTPTQSAQTSDDFPAHVIALIVIAALLLLALVVALIVIYRGRRRYTKQQRLMHHLSPTNDIYASAELGKTDSDSTAPVLPLPLPLPRQDQEEGVGAGVINPIFQDDDPESLPQVTPRSHSEDGEENVGQEGGGPKSHVSSRHPDADSGVPSDRENGGEEEEEGSERTSPTLSRGEGPPEPVGSSYLAAVLHDLMTSSADPVEDDVEDMIDVTSPPALYTDAGLDLYADSPAFSPQPQGRPGQVHSSRQYSDDAPPSPPPPPPPQRSDDSRYGPYVQSFKVNTQTTQAEANSKNKTDGLVDDVTDDVRKSMTLSEETGEVSGPSSSDPAYLLAAVLHQHLMAADQSAAGNEEEEDDPEAFGSKLGSLVRASTPPMHRAHSQEEEEEDDDSLPEEPEPDYAKKVRFSMQVEEMFQDLGSPTEGHDQQDQDHLPAGDADQEPSLNGDGPEKEPEEPRKSEELSAGDSSQDTAEEGGPGSEVATLLIRELKQRVRQVEPEAESVSTPWQGPQGSDGIASQQEETTAF